ERIEKRVKEALVVSGDRAGEQHEQIDVGVEAQLAATVAAEREDRYRVRRRTGIGKQLLDERVHAMRVLAERVQPAPAAFCGGYELLARRRETPCVRHGTRRGRCVGFRHRVQMRIKT